MQSEVACRKKKCTHRQKMSYRLSRETSSWPHIDRELYFLVSNKHPLLRLLIFESIWPQNGQILFL